MANRPHRGLAQWSPEAAFVFSGRVVSLGTNNLDGVEPDERMATVEVDDVALAPRELGDLRGRTVTVYLETTEGVESGQQLTFFARGWHLGRNVGVVELGRSDSSADEIRRPLGDQRLRDLDAQLAERVRTAQTIISGHVLATERVGRSETLPGFLEGVEWWTAEIWIASVEKGSPPPDGRIWYPEGGEPEWGPIPKAHAGQAGVWLLRPLTGPDDREGSEPLAGAGEGAAGPQPAPGPQPHPDPHPHPHPGPGPEPGRPLMALDPLDYHAVSALPRIQVLLSMQAGP